MTQEAHAWSERSAFAGWDWARDHHDVLVVDPRGTVVEDFRIDDTGEGWQRARQRLSPYPGLALAIETSSGAVVERLLEAGFAVFPVNPKAAKRYRERKAPSGTKTDRVDAWSLADALRLDGHTWRPLKPDDPLTVELASPVSRPDGPDRATQRADLPAPGGAAGILSHRPEGL